MTTVQKSAGDAVDDHFDDDLVAEALAAGSPDQAIPVDAVPFDPGAEIAASSGPLLPDWYMPVAVRASTKRSHRVMAWAFIGSLVAINLSGLCVTYGHLVIA